MTRQPNWILIALYSVVASSAAEPNLDSGPATRVLLTTSRVIGSPDPPAPYSVEETFTNIDWTTPIFALREPGTGQLFFIENSAREAVFETVSEVTVAKEAKADEVHDGVTPNEDEVTDDDDKSKEPVEISPAVPARILRVPDNPDAIETEVVLELYAREVYAVAFHPNYEQNGQIFISGKFSVNEKLTNRVSRYTVSREAPYLCDTESEETIVEWESTGHDGGGVVFGQDGMLYVTTGDGTTDSDTWLTAQDVTRLQGSVLRIDVDHPAKGQPYSIPDDNPFVDLEGARGEIWAIGLRNPWRMSIDEQTGQIWVGENGQDLWEFAHLVRRAANYGWSVYEGSHPFYLHRQLGPAEFVAPTVEHSHSEFRSLAGGVVYYGDQLPELNGTYIYGDYSTGAIWGARHDGEELTWHRQLARTTLNIVGFANTPSGNLLILDYTGSIYRLVTSPPLDQPHEFPHRLSETGIFTSVEDHELQAGMIPYAINAPGWIDGAQAERYMGLPGETQITRDAQGNWTFPEGAVLIQTLSTPDSSRSNGGQRRLETRLLTLQQDVWAGYSYRWNEDQSDATLVDASGEQVDLAKDPSAASPEMSHWRIPSRLECMSCHSRAALFALGLNDLQMDRDVVYFGERQNQLARFKELGLFANDTELPLEDRPELVDPYDSTQSLHARARSYLHTNCSVCHTNAGGGNSRIMLGITEKDENMRLISAHPQHATFSILQPLLVAPGEPERSVLYHRLSRRGPGQMPPRGSDIVDTRAVELIREWIAQMPSTRVFVKDWQFEDLADDLPLVDQQRSHESGLASFQKVGCNQCHRFAGEGGGAGPLLTGLTSRQTAAEILESILEPSRKIEPKYAESIVYTDEGKSIRGRIERETETDIVLRTNDTFAPPVLIAKANIEERHFSDTSMMPDDVLNSLEKEEILDLLAYLVADGDPTHRIFQAEDP